MEIMIVLSVVSALMNLAAVVLKVVLTITQLRRTRKD